MTETTDQIHISLSKQNARIIASYLALGNAIMNDEDLVMMIAAFGDKSVVGLLRSTTALMTGATYNSEVHKLSFEEFARLISERSIAVNQLVKTILRQTDPDPYAEVFKRD